LRFEIEADKVCLDEEGVKEPSSKKRF